MLMTKENLLEKRDNNLEFGGADDVGGGIA